MKRPLEAARPEIVFSVFDMAMVRRVVKEAPDFATVRDIFDARFNETTVLHMCAMSGCAENVAVLRRAVEFGVDIDVVDGSGRTPLMNAVEYGRVEATRLLVEAGAVLEARCNLGLTPLLHAMRQGALETAHVLLEYGANVDIYEPPGGYPIPVHVLFKERAAGMFESLPPVVVPWTPAAHCRFRAPFHRQAVTWMCIATRRAGIPRYVAMLVLPCLAAAYRQGAAAGK